MPPVSFPGEIVPVGCYEDEAARLAILIDRDDLERSGMAREPETRAFLLSQGSPYLATVRLTGRFAMVCPDLADDSGASRRLADVLHPWQHQSHVLLEITTLNADPVITIR